MTTSDRHQIGGVKRFLALLAALTVMAAACGVADEPADVTGSAPAPSEAEPEAVSGPVGDDEPESPPSTYPDSEGAEEDDGAPTEPPAVEPEEPSGGPAAEDQLGVGATLAPEPAESREPPPEFTLGMTSEDYLEELVAWTMADAEMGVSEEAAQADQAFTVCVSESFAAAFDAARRDELALTLSQEENLWYGLPYDLLTPDEMERWTTAARPCFEVSIDYATSGTSLLREMVEMILPAMQDPEDRVRMEASVLECLSALASDEGFTSTTLHDLVFDMPFSGMEEELALALFDLCGESLMDLILIETLVAEEGMERSVAECAAPTMLDMTRYEFAVYAPSEQPPEDDQEAMFEFLAALAECGLDTEDMFGIPDGAQAERPVPAQVSDVAIESEPLVPFEGQSPDPAVGQRAPAFAATTFDGVEVTVLPGDGTAKVIIFLAHWCPHCQRELPRIADWLATNDLPVGVEVIAVSTAVDPSGDNYPPSAWFEDEQWPAAVVRDSAQNEIAQGYGLQGYPYMVALDADGLVVSRVSGELADDDWESLLQIVAPAPYAANGS